MADFLEALHRVAAGATVLDPEVVAQLLVRRHESPLERLTPRESEVLALMADGRSNNGIVEALRVSAGAVEKYVTNIFLKLDLPPMHTDHRRVLAVLTFLGARTRRVRQPPPDERRCGRDSCTSTTAPMSTDDGVTAACP